MRVHLYTAGKLCSKPRGGQVTGRPKRYVAGARPRDWMDLLHPTAEKTRKQEDWDCLQLGGV